MGFSLWVEVNHPDGYTSVFDVVDGQTYNLGSMWRACGIVPADERMEWLQGQNCLDLQAKAMSALADYWANPRKYDALEPDNGWGDAEGWYERGLLPFALAVHRHPTGIINGSF